MKKLAIIAFLVLVLIACAPVMPARNQTMNKTVEPVMAKNETSQHPVMAKNETKMEPAPKVDLRDVPKKEATEGDLVSFPDLRAVDPDGDPIKYTFTSPLNEKGQWQTKEGDAGDHLVTITASDGSNTVSQQVLLVINSKNKPPVIELEEPVEAKEGETFTIKPTITDPEGDPIGNVSYSGWMTNDTMIIGHDESGLHKVMISASDGKSTTTKEVIVSVQNDNRAPELADISAQDIKEGQKVTIKPSAKDPDGDSITYTFDFPLNEQGSWQTAIGDAGDYEVAVMASDGNMSTQKTFKLTVEAINQPPVIELDPVNVEEGQTVVLNPTITDKEGDEVRVSYSGWMNSNTKSTGYDDAGAYNVTISARDTAGNEARLDVTVSVKDVNRPPIFGAGSFN